MVTPLGAMVKIVDNQQSWIINGGGPAALRARIPGEPD